MSRRNSSPVEILLEAPWWTSLVLGAAAYVLLRWIIPFLMPRLMSPFTFMVSFMMASRALAPFAAKVFIMISVLSGGIGILRRRLRK
jgi:hypothetical protein